MRKEIKDFVEYIKAETENYDNSDFLAEKYGDFFQQEITGETYENFISYHTEKRSVLPKTVDFLQKFSEWHEPWNLKKSRFFVVGYPIGMDNILKVLEIYEEEYEFPEDATEEERKYIEKETDLCCNDCQYGYLSTGYGIALHVNFQILSKEITEFLQDQDEDDISDTDKTEILKDLGLYELGFRIENN